MLIKDFCVIDTETTGTDPQADTLVEVGAIRDDGQAISTLINPGVPIPATASAVHHIIDEDVLGKPDRDQAVKALAQFIGDRTPVAYNAQFDASFLPEINKPWLCLYRLARHLYPGAPGHGNQVLRYWLKTGVKPSGDPHRALADVEVSLATMQHMFNRCRELGMTDLSEIIRYANQPIIVTVMPNFGKYANKPFAEIPVDYFEYMLRQNDLDADLRVSFDQEVQRRKEKPINSTMNDSASSGAPKDPAEFVIQFGKHQGKSLKEVPKDYLEWLLTKDFVKPDLRASIDNYLCQSQPKAKSFRP